MKKQVVYNFSKLTGDYQSTAPSHQEYPSRKTSRDKLAAPVVQDPRISHRIFRPTGIVKVRKDEVSSSRSSVRSIPRESIKVTAKPYLNQAKKGNFENAEEYFERFEMDYVVKYHSIQSSPKVVKRCLFRELESKEKSNRPVQMPTFQLPCLRLNQFRSSVANSRRSNSKESLVSNRSQTRLTMREIENKYKESEQKIKKIRERVNEMYRLNSQNSEKEFRSLVTRPKSNLRYEHRLLL